MIQIKPEKKSKKTKCDPYYELVYNYMIGDSNGDTTEEVQVSLNNPFLERYCTLLNRLEPTKGYWGISLDSYRLNAHYKENQITEDEYKFLLATAFAGDEEEGDEYFKTEEEIDYAHELSEGVRSEAEYSFLVFEGVTLYYVDEYGKRHETEFVEDKSK